MDMTLRDQLVVLLRGGEAHSPVERAVCEFPQGMAGSRAGAIPHTPWRLLEHMRIAQWDILEYCQNPDHISREKAEQETYKLTELLNNDDMKVKYLETSAKTGENVNTAFEYLAHLIIESMGKDN